MKFNLAKYAFISKEQADEKIASLYDLDAPKFRFEKPIILGNILFKAEVLDELGGVLTDAVYSGKWHVDMCWYDLDTHPLDWGLFYEEVDGNGIVKVAGINYNDHKF